MCCRGPHGGQLVELAQLSFIPGNCAVIFHVLELRLLYPPEKWRNVYKALSVLEFLIQRGSEDAVRRAKSEHTVALVRRLEGFSYVTKEYRDVGSSVKHRAAAILSLLEDESQLRTVRDCGHLQSLRMAGLHSVKETGAVGGDKGFSKEYIDRVEIEEDESDGEDVTDEIDDYTKHAGELMSGDIKVVSDEENARHANAIKLLLAREENKICADCQINGAGSKPTWASVSLGVFICLRCAGIHRGLGVHISQVRSCSLDRWNLQQVIFMAECGGNVNANKYWEGKLNEDRPTPRTLGELEQLIKNKYVEKKYIAEGIEWPPENPSLDSDVRTILLDAMDEDMRKSSKWAEEPTSEVEPEQPPVSSMPEESENLINLMDLLHEGDINNTPIEDKADEINGKYDEDLSKLFAEPEKKSAFETIPQNFESWDMGLLLQTPKPDENDDENKPLAQDASSSVEETTEKASRDSYKPFWAPNTTSSSSNAAPSPPQLLTQGPTSEFESAFDFIPSQFTSNSSVEGVSELADTLALIGLGSKAVTPETTDSEKRVKPSKNSNTHLKPHEMKAQALIMGGLESFDAGASLVAVSPKQQPSIPHKMPMKKSK